MIGYVPPCLKRGAKTLTVIVLTSDSGKRTTGPRKVSLIIEYTCELLSKQIYGKKGTSFWVRQKGPHHSEIKKHGSGPEIVKACPANPTFSLLGTKTQYSTFSSLLQHGRPSKLFSIHETINIKFQNENLNPKSLPRSREW